MSSYEPSLNGSVAESTAGSELDFGGENEAQYTLPSLTTLVRWGQSRCCGACWLGDSSFGAAPPQSGLERHCAAPGQRDLSCARHRALKPCLESRLNGCFSREAPASAALRRPPALVLRRGCLPPACADPKPTQLKQLCPPPAGRAPPPRSPRCRPTAAPPPRCVPAHPGHSMRVLRCTPCKCMPCPWVVHLHQLAACATTRLAGRQPNMHCMPRLPTPCAVRASAPPADVLPRCLLAGAHRRCAAPRGRLLPRLGCDVALLLNGVGPQ